MPLSGYPGCLGPRSLGLPDGHLSGRLSVPKFGAEYLDH